MKTTLKKTCVISVISAMLIVCSVLVLVQAQSAQGQLGKDLASEIREVVQTHKADIQDFILEMKVNGAETSEAKLEVVEEYVAALRAKIDDAKSAREELIADLQAGNITEEEFAMEMKALALELADVAKTMGTLGEELGAMGQSVAGTIRESVEELVAELQGFADEMSAIGKSIAEDMANKELPIPDIPVTPPIPELPDLPEIPNV